MEGALDLLPANWQPYALIVAGSVAVWLSVEVLLGFKSGLHSLFIRIFSFGDDDENPRRLRLARVEAAFEASIGLLMIIAGLSYLGV